MARSVDVYMRKKLVKYTKKARTSHPSLLIFPIFHVQVVNDDWDLSD